MSDTEIPEPDRAPGVPHPRFAPSVIGQDAADAQFLEAFTSDRMHHAWLISGLRGTGKATLAWRLARFLLTQPEDDGGGLFGAPPPPTSLDVDPDHPVLPRLTALSEPRLMLIRRGWDDKREVLRTEITVDEVRKLNAFFGMSAADGGRRVVIVDAVDEMNVSAANALLKVLEEPPARTTLLLISHQPARLLPTILSRCRRLRCAPLAEDAIAQVMAQSEAEVAPEEAAALTSLSGGSAGMALSLLQQDGLSRYGALVRLYRDGFDRQAALSLSDGLAGRAQAPKLEMLLQLFDLFLTRLARAGLQPLPQEAAQGEAALFQRLCPSPAASRHWATLAQELSARARHGQAVNLDPSALILDITFKIHKTASALTR